MKPTHRPYFLMGLALLLSSAALILLGIFLSKVLLIYLFPVAIGLMLVVKSLAGKRPAHRTARHALKRPAVIVPFLLVLVFGFFSYRALRSAWISHFAHWPRVEGVMVAASMADTWNLANVGHGANNKILVAKKSWGVATRYSYLVKGKAYQGDRARPHFLPWKTGLLDEGSAKYAKKRLKRYAPGRKVQVHYNPANPEEAYLDLKTISAFWAIALQLAIWAILMLTRFVHGMGPPQSGTPPKEGAAAGTRQWRDECLTLVFLFFEYIAALIACIFIIGAGDYAPESWLARLFKDEIVFLLGMPFLLVGVKAAAGIPRCLIAALGHRKSKHSVGS